MGFPGLSPEEIVESQKRYAIADAKIAELKRAVQQLKEDATKHSILAPILPRWAEVWLQKRLMPEAMTEAIQKAQVEHDWAVYDKMNRSRPMYPRPRTLSIVRSNGAQRVSMQSKCLFFSTLPPELRRLIYLYVLGGLKIDIRCAHGGHGGPKGSEGRFIIFSSNIQDSAGRMWHGGLESNMGSHLPAVQKFKPSIIPLLQSCRRM